MALLTNEIDMRWVGTDDPDFQRTVEGADAVWAVPGSPYVNDEAAYAAITHARTTGQAFLGTCGGSSTPWWNTPATSQGGRAQVTPRPSPTPTSSSSIVSPAACSANNEPSPQWRAPSSLRSAALHRFVGFNFCNFGVPDAQMARLVEHGVIVSAHAEAAGVEGIELPDHPFFVATFQPQMAALPNEGVHPLIRALIGSAA